MIPYIGFTTFNVGPVPIQVWGTMVAIGILVGLFVVVRRSNKLNLDTKIIMDAATWALVASIIGARLVTVLFYDFGYYFTNPLQVFAVWNGGLSSVGGFIGAVLVGFWYLKRKNVDVWKYADTMVFGLPIGLGIGRIGCFLIHDHPGTASDFILAVQYPNGETKLDHGLLLAINGFLMAIIFAFMSRKKLPVGSYLAVISLWYGVVRFILDFYRVGDATYFGLTPAQYVSLALAIGGVWGIWRLYMKRLTTKEASE
jgi:phosphatidylglycerol---prolipoprotein diacylglyceryl transferase